MNSSRYRTDGSTPDDSLERVIREASPYVVVSNSFRTTTMDRVRRQRRRKRGFQTTAAAMIGGVILAWTPPHMIFSRVANFPVFRAMTPSTASAELQQEILDQAGSDGSQMPWAVYEAVARRRGILPR